MILHELESHVLTLLQPVVGSVCVDAIRVETFASLEDISDLLSRFKDRCPAAFLSVPRVNFNSVGVATRLSDFTAQYSFLVGYALDRDNHDAQRSRAFSDFAQIAAALQHKGLRSTVGFHIDFARLSDWDFLQTPDAVASLTRFQIRVSRITI
jgi:hypothetical protein